MIDMPGYDDADEDDDDLEPDPSTVDDCVDEWRRALADKGELSVLAVGDLAAELSAGEPATLAMWVRSIQMLRASGEMRPDVASYLIDDIIERHFDQTDVFEDPGIADINDRMREFEQACGYDEPGAFDNDPRAPKEWIALTNEWDAREEERRRELLLELGEHEMVRDRAEDPIDHWLRLDTTGRQLRRQHGVILRRNWNTEEDGPFDDAWLNED